MQKLSTQPIARKQGILHSAMEAYKKQTAEVIERFLDHRLSFLECTAALDDALADLLPRLTTDKQLVPLRALTLANSEIVMKEMERRGPQGASPG